MKNVFAAECLASRNGQERPHRDGGRLQEQREASLPKLSKLNYGPHLLAEKMSTNTS